MRKRQVSIGLAILILTSCAGHLDASSRAPAQECTDDEIKISIIKSDRFDLAFVEFRNTSDSSCWLQGYPQLTLLDDALQQLPTHVVFSDTQPVNRVALHSDGGWAIASFSSPRTGPAGSCETSQALRIGLPRSQGFFSIKTSRTYCKHGELDVSPIFHPSGGNLPLPSPPP